VDPKGNVLADAGDRSESLKIVEIRAEDADDKSITANNDLFKDRRVAFYKPLVVSPLRKRLRANCEPSGARRRFARRRFPFPSMS